MPPKKMEAKIAALESEVTNLKTTVAMMSENQEKMMTMLAQSLNQSKDGDGENTP